jgi:hypothetical protein
MVQEYPVQPPKDMVSKWTTAFETGNASPRQIAHAMYKAGADAQLGKCGEWVKWFVHPESDWVGKFYETMRPRYEAEPDYPEQQNSLLNVLNQLTSQVTNATSLELKVDALYTSVKSTLRILSNVESCSPSLNKPEEDPCMNQGSESLVKVVEEAIARAPYSLEKNEAYAACAAISAVADWLQKRNPAAIGWCDMIREEVGRHG